MSVLYIIPLFAILTLAFAGLIFIRRRFVVITVRGYSMAPTLEEGDRVLVRRSAPGSLQRGAIAVFGCPPPSQPEVVPEFDGWLVKRVVALPGDPIPKAFPELSAHTRVPEDCFLSLGDNAAYSLDSRTYGFVEVHRLLGTVVRKMKPSSPCRARLGGLL